MIKGLAITPPVLGRISIGKVVQKNGQRLPEKDDQYLRARLKGMREFSKGQFRQSFEKSQSQKIIDIYH